MLKKIIQALPAMALIIGSVIAGAMLDQHFASNDVLMCQIVDHSANTHLMPCRIVDSYLAEINL